MAAETPAMGVVVITGATRGIGKATAIHFAAKGFRVAVVGRSRDRGARVVSEITATGGSAECFTCDMSDEANVSRLFADIVSTFGRVDVVVNNAAKTDVTDSDRRVTEQSLEAFDGFVRANLYSVFLAFKYGIPAMGEAGGSFVTISSTAAALSRPAEPSYGSSKAAAAALTRQVAVDYGPDDIRANVLMLGFVSTNATAPLLEDGTVGPIVRAATPGRIPTSNDVAKAVMFLAGDTGFNGATLTLDGGMSVRSQIPELT